ncbi:hypothetical protein PTMSG1_01416 [Pyrenophora teres f. maculata]|nr:hypothetical protein PTMSG1_01416 [Pyrenophora teres f. maculata]
MLGLKLAVLLAFFTGAIAEKHTENEVFNLVQDQVTGKMIMDSSSPTFDGPVLDESSSAKNIAEDASTYTFELFPFTGANCTVATGVYQQWPTQLLRDGGFEYIQKHRLGLIHDDMVELFDPDTSEVAAYKDAFNLRCTKTQNIRSFYMFHDPNIGHLGYGVDDLNKILYMCFMLGQDINGVQGSGDECFYY